MQVRGDYKLYFIVESLIYLMPIELWHCTLYSLSAELKRPQQNEVGVLDDLTDSRVSACNRFSEFFLVLLWPSCLTVLIPVVNFLLGCNIWDKEVPHPWSFTTPRRKTSSEANLGDPAALTVGPYLPIHELENIHSKENRVCTWWEKELNREVK